MIDGSRSRNRVEERRDGAKEDGELRNLKAKVALVDQVGLKIEILNDNLGI